MMLKFEATLAENNIPDNAQVPQLTQALSDAGKRKYELTIADMTDFTRLSG